MGEGSPGARRRILIVEDDENTRTALAGWLACDYDVVTARDGLEALEIAATVVPGLDLIVSDVWMPRLDGVEMCAVLQRDPVLSGIPVIFLTGQTSPSSVVAGIAAGARAYLEKPVDLDVLDSKVKSALERGRTPIRRRDADHSPRG